jgi:hypothetical protein
VSVPYNIVECAHCGARWSTNMTWGYFDYEIGTDVRLSVDRVVGWCHDCSGFRPIEKLPCPKELVQKVLAAEDNLETLRRSYVETMGRGWRRWTRFVWPPPSALTKPLARLIAELEILHTTLCWRDGRDTPERCLECGSTTCEYLDWGERKRHRWRGKLPLAFRHPGCGGILLVQNAPAWLSSCFTSRRVYDSEGRLVRQEPVDDSGYRT